MFDRLPDPNAGAHQLTFRKEEILFIDNTMYNGTPGHWSAWLVDVDGQRGEWGVVPSKYKVCKQYYQVFVYFYWVCLIFVHYTT